MLGMLQALIVSVGDLLILKAGVESPVLFVLITIFCSIIFNSIVYTCVSLLGNPGKPLQSYCLYYKLQVVGVHSQFKRHHNFSKHFTILYHLRMPLIQRETVGGIVPEILITKLIILTLFGIDSSL